jgi:hypothetical protein
MKNRAFFCYKIVKELTVIKCKNPEQAVIVTALPIRDRTSQKGAAKNFFLFIFR